jgi:hypothetical protein
VKTLHVVLLTIVLCGAAARAGAQTAGVRVGVSGSPNQFYGGLHYESGELIDRLRFRPNLEIGVGNDSTLVALNFEFAYHLPSIRSPWDVYVGAGPALNIYKVTNDTNPGGGFNFIVGLAHTKGLFTELKIGAGNSPNVKFAVGYTFRP